MEFENLGKNKAFIKKEANRLGISVGAAYTTYYARDLLERLSKINYETIVVKGSFSQYVHLGKLNRPVLDIDLTSVDYHQKSIYLLYKTIYESQDNIITYDVTSLPHTTNNGVYKIPVVAIVKYPGDKKFLQIPIGVDYKEQNKVIFEKKYSTVPPLFTGDRPFFISTPSFEEHLAEKLYIILHNSRQDMLNTRVKDFYDVFELFDKSYDKTKLKLYFNTMLLLYGMDEQNLSTSFLNDEYIKNHREIWEAMKRKYEFMDGKVKFEDAVYYAKEILDRQIDSIGNNDLKEQVQTLVDLVLSRQKEIENQKVLVKR